MYMIFMLSLKSSTPRINRSLALKYIFSPHRHSEEARNLKVVGNQPIGSLHRRNIHERFALFVAGKNHYTMHYFHYTV